MWSLFLWWENSLNQYDLNDTLHGFIGWVQWHIEEKLHKICKFKNIFFHKWALTLLDMAGGLLAPPFFKGQIVKKTLRVKKSEKICIPLLISLLCTLCFTFYQNHLICLQNEFEKTNPESRSPKGSCHIWRCLEVFLLQNSITHGRLCFRPQQSGGKAWLPQSSETTASFTFGF